MTGDRTCERVQSWRLAKHREMLRLFPFMREDARWRPFWLGRRRWAVADTLCIYDALRPFREIGELPGAQAVVAAAGARFRSIDARSVEGLIVNLRYRNAYERRAAYRDPVEWVRENCVRGGRPRRRPEPGRDAPDASPQAAPASLAA